MKVNFIQGMDENIIMPMWNEEATANLGFHIAGNNDAIPGSPDIDVLGGMIIGVSGADGSPITSLPGLNKRDMYKFDLNINFDSSGNAVNVSSNGTTFSIAQWNQMFTQLDPSNSDVSTGN